MGNLENPAGFIIAKLSIYLTWFIHIMQKGRGNKNRFYSAISFYGNMKSTFLNQYLSNINISNKRVHTHENDMVQSKCFWTIVNILHGFMDPNIYYVDVNGTLENALWFRCWVGCNSLRVRCTKYRNQSLQKSFNQFICSNFICDFMLLWQSYRKVELGINVKCHARVDIIFQFGVKYMSTKHKYLIFIYL